MATTIYDYLLRRKADLEARMLEAQRRAQAPFEDELRALSLALGAIERGGLAEHVDGEPVSFAHGAPSRRGRKPRSTREMILLVLGAGDAAIAASEISRKLTRRWARHSAGRGDAGAPGPGAGRPGPPVRRRVGPDRRAAGSTGRGRGLAAAGDQRLRRPRVTRLP